MDIPAVFANNMKVVEYISWHWLQGKMKKCRFAWRRIQQDKMVLWSMNAYKRMVSEVVIKMNASKHKYQIRVSQKPLRIFKNILFKSFLEL